MKTGMKDCCAVILAGGQGTRMMSDTPKVLIEVAYTPMLWWVTDACRKAGIEKICVVTGHKNQMVKEYINQNFTGIETALQAEQKGTGHALMQAEKFIRGSGCRNLLVLCGDAPFIDNETITNAYKLHRNEQSAITVVTAELDAPFGYGRILREGQKLTSIVEQKELSEEQKGIKEVNSGAYWFDAEKLINALNKLSNNNSKGEYYLTDTLSLLIGNGQKACAYLTENKDVVLGANTCRDLFELNQKARMQVIYSLLDLGVQIPCADGVVISPGVSVGKGTKILPNTQITGDCVIGENCVIGPGSVINNAKVGDGSVINATQIYQSEIGDNVRIGPFSQIRPNCKIADGVKIGDFVEVKNSNIGDKTSIAHLTYIGDSDVGGRVNFGCGVVTVNYDGVGKYRTVIGDNAFIGCNTNLVAPVKIGEGAYTAAGSTVTKDVPADSLVIERGQQIVKEGWAKKKLKPKE